jgi:serine/threonine protein kinase
MQKSNLCIVTEHVKQGSLRDVLSNPAIALSWPQRLMLLRSAALGVHYLHTLDPHRPILHRHLKSSNLLVVDDRCDNVKVSGFGFARMKQESEAMTGRCGSPCWTAPEVLLGQGRHCIDDGDGGCGTGKEDGECRYHYDEKADVYSFGVVMWEVLTRQLPFAGRPFLEVALDVIAGRRPPLPPASGQEHGPNKDVHESDGSRNRFSELVERCWHAEPEQRPTMEQVVCALDRILASAIDNSSLAHMV